MPMVTLLTDFGLADTYVGQVKAAVLAVAPDATLVDLPHAVAPQDVFGGPLLLWSAVEPCPAGAVHLAVVDPGVGSARRAVAVRAKRGDVLVGPDNGLLVPALRRLGGIDAAVELTRRRFWRATLSTTFHGRDIFGPVAGHLASGVALEQLGTAIEDLVQLEFPAPHGTQGEVLHIDTYGNLVTNIAADVLPASYRVHIGQRVIEPAPNYAAVLPGRLLAIVGTYGLLEVSVREGSAAAELNAGRGTKVSVVES